MIRIVATLLITLVLGGCAAAGGVPAGGNAAASADRPMSELPPATAADARAKVHVDMGMAYFQVGRYDVALDEARAALAQQGSYSPAFHLMGLVYMYIDDLPAARANFERALGLAPNDPDFNNSYGWFQCATGQEREGLERLAVAARNPYYGTPTRPHTNAGLCHLRLKDDAAAEAQFRRAVQLDPANVQALFHLAGIAYRRGAYEQARVFLVQLHQQREPTAESAWLGLRTERKLGNRDAESSYAAQLRGRFADTVEFQNMKQGRYE